MQIETRITGVEETLRQLGGIRAGTSAIIEGLIARVAEETLRVSSHYCPIDTGDLRASARIERSGRGADAVFTVVYAADYAGYVHEILHYHHEPPTQAKFLERAVSEVYAYADQLVQDGFNTEFVRLRP